MLTVAAVFLRAGCVTGSSTAPTALMKRQPYVSPSTKHIAPFIHFLSLFHLSKLFIDIYLYIEDIIYFIHNYIFIHLF